MAASAVAYSHASNAFGVYRPVGAIGVDLFFVISGFIMAGQKPERFMQNRLTRILPLYYLILPIFLVNSLLSEKASLGGWLSALTLWPVWGNYYHPQMGVAWSLCFEMLFYVCVWQVFRGIYYLWLLTAYSVSMVLATITGLALFRYLGSPIILEFLFGVLIYRLEYRNEAAGIIALIGGSICLALLVVMGTGGLEERTILEPTAFLRPILFGLPVALIVFGAIHFDWNWRPLTFLGDASYSIYLTHILTIAAIFTLKPHPLVATAAAVAVGAAVYRWIERPLLRYVKDLRVVRRIQERTV